MTNTSTNLTIIFHIYMLCMTQYSIFSRGIKMLKCSETVLSELNSMWKTESIVPCLFLLWAGGLRTRHHSFIKWRNVKLYTIYVLTNVKCIYLYIIAIRPSVVTLDNLRLKGIASSSSPNTFQLPKKKG